MIKRLAKSLIVTTRLNRPRISPPSVMFYPPFIDHGEILDAFYKARYYLLPSMVKDVTVPVHTKAKISQLAQEIPNYVGKINFPETKHIRIIGDQEIKLGYHTLFSDYVLITDWNRIHDNGILRNISKKLVNVDRHSNQFDGWNWGNFLTSIQKAQMLDQQRDNAHKRFINYLDGLPKFSKAYVFGTGPSLEQAYDYDFSDGYRIVCNTIVKNQPLLDHIQPHFLVAADAIYHFGNNAHAHQFRRDLVRSLLQNHFMFIMPENFYPLIKYYHPEIIKFTLPVRQDLRGIFMNMRSVFAYTNVHNILNALLLPLASSLANEIFLLGFDGRSENDQLFWKNSEANSYPDLRSSIMAAHPAFFSKMDFEEYARWQSDGAEKIMQLGESEGKKYICLNKSFIPAFQNRRV